MNAAVEVVLFSYHQDPGHGGQPTSSSGGDQVHHAVCHWLLWRVQWGGFVPDDRPSRTTAGNGSILITPVSSVCHSQDSETRNNLKVSLCSYKVWREDARRIVTFTCCCFFLVVWHLSNCSDHDQNAEQRQVLEAHEWDGDHWKQVGGLCLSRCFPLHCCLTLALIVEMDSNKPGYTLIQFTQPPGRAPERWDCAWNHQRRQYGPGLDTVHLPLHPNS